MLRWLSALVVGGVVSGFAFLLLTGRYENDGPVLITVARNHGLHAGDVFVIAGWAGAMLALLWFVVASGRHSLLPSSPPSHARTERTTFR